MNKEGNEITNLNDLKRLRSAPKLNNKQSKLLFDQAKDIIDKADWLTIGVMAPSIEIGMRTIKTIEKTLQLEKFNYVTVPSSKGPIFLKGNQKTGEVHARIEYGLGEGILISCHDCDNAVMAETIGPFPVKFFSEKIIHN